MNKITLCENTFDASTWETFENIGDVRDFLVKHFDGKWPSSAHIYLDHVANNADITPYDDAGIERLGKVKGHFYVVVYPEGLELIIAVVALAVAAVAVGLSFLLRPHPPKTKQYNSTNNQLADRQNTARPNARISDIYGQLWDTFDLLSVPYKIFANNQEIEYCFMCVGRGYYQFESIAGLVQIRDDTTPLSQIAGASAQVFNPGNGPGGTPDLLIGTSFNEPLVNLSVFSGVNGQVCKAPNLNSWGGPGSGSNTLRFRSPNIIENSTGVDWTNGFQVGDTLYIGGFVANDDIAIDSAGIQPTVHLGGTYVISGVTTTQISLSGPSAVNPNWSALAAFGGGVSAYGSDNMMANNTFWVGLNEVDPTPTPFWINRPDITQLWCNFICPQGCYYVDSTGTQHATNDTFVVGVTPCDASGNPSGTEHLTNGTVYGSSFSRQAAGTTVKIFVTPGLGGILVRARRTSNTNLATNVQVQDELQWRDCYIVSSASPTLGDVTTIQTKLVATPSALATKNRKFNALVTRKVPVPSGGALAASTNAADIICAMALDPAIGNLKTTDIDVAGIYALAGPGGAIQSYFAMFPDTTLPTQFCYTFDDETMSFEESLTEIAASIFCVAYRRGGILSLSFEKQTPNSTLLFNHRNKIPKSETRTVTFGTLTANDGINLDYIEPNAPNYPNLDTTVTLYFPPDQSAKNPKKVKAIGVRNSSQATVLGWRMYWKLLAQNTTVQFEATEEATLLVQQDRILVADNTRSDTQDGEVTNQVSLLLTLSQPVVFDARFSYSIFLQHPDETVESIPITAGPLPNQVVLGHAPTIPCIFLATNYAATTYMIVSNAPVRQSAFLVSEKTSRGNKTFEVKAVNYDDIYYSHDKDFQTNIGIAQEVMEAVVTPPASNADVAAFVIEVVTQ